MSILKLKDSQGNWVGVPTVKGDNGNGISSAVLNNDYTLTLTFTDGTTYTTPSIRGEKGEQGEPASSMNIHICSSNEYDSQTRVPIIAQPDDKTFYLVPTEDGTSPDLFTEWVYVNNAWEMFGSAKIDLSNYVTNTDYATANNGGIVKIGTGLKIGGDGERIYTDPANGTQIKVGTDAYRPLTPFWQSYSTFYGLAKASGDSTQSASSNAVGTYTDEAKASIKNMLGVQDGMVVNATLVSGTQYTIDSTYDAIKTALSAGKTVVVMTGGVPQPYVGNVQLYDEWYLAFGVSTIYDNIATLTGFMIPETYQNVAIWTQQNTTIPTLSDVQVNGQSIVADGVANVPVASTSVLGAVRSRVGDNGIQILGSGYLGTYVASDSDVKNGIHSYRPLSPNRQHSATFYGLAKAAGADEKNSTLTVGNYTDNAKDKIQTMLGVSPLIAPHESDPFESAHVIGELFIINGKLYRAKTALTAGEYVNEGTNVEVVDTSDVYVKNTDIASLQKAGIVKVANTYGIQLYNGEYLRIDRALLPLIKQGTDNDHPIVTQHQHEATFYGLAKASGDTTQSQSDNAVGTYTDNAKSSIQTMLGLDDVVRDTDYATSSTAGVVKADSDWGIGMYDPTWSGGAYGNFLYISPASSAQIKAGSTSYKAIVPNAQHEAVFYGLAKASGDTTQASSSNVVGTYTSEAKTAIKQMLDIHDTIDSFVEEVSGTDVTITGQPSYRYNCGEVLSLSITPPSSGTIDFRFTSGSTPTVLTLPSTVKMPEWWVEVEANTIYEMCITDGIYCGVMSWAI